MTPAQRLTVLMLSDLLDGLKIQTELNPRLIRKMIEQGHLWALDWEMPFLRSHDDTHSVVNEVVEVIELYALLEASFSALPKHDKDEIGRLAKPVFVGFCPATEAQHHEVARFLILDMGRFPAFHDRPLDAPKPTLQRARTLLHKLQRLSGEPVASAKRLTAGELRELLITG